MQRVLIPRLSIWERSFACRTNRNATFVRLKNFAAQKIRKSCPSRNPDPAQNDLSKDTHWSLATARFCSSNHPHAGVGCGFCRDSKHEAFGQPVYKSTFPFTHHRIAFVVYRHQTPNRIAPAQQWFESIDHIAMPSPHRRAAQALLSAKQVA